MSRTDWDIDLAMKIEQTRALLQLQQADRLKVGLLPYNQPIPEKVAWVNPPKKSAAPQAGDYQVHVEKGRRWGWWWDPQQYGDTEWTSDYTLDKASKWRHLTHNWLRTASTGARFMRWSTTLERAQQAGARLIRKHELKLEREADRKAQTTNFSVSLSDLR